jgi:hypothetical protein
LVVTDPSSAPLAAVDIGADDAVAVLVKPMLVSKSPVSLLRVIRPLAALMRSCLLPFVSVMTSAVMPEIAAAVIFVASESRLSTATL